MRLARQQWRARQSSLEARRLVFLDETWVATNMTRRYGRAPCGERCLAPVPHGHWKTTTFLAALRCDGLHAPFALDGPMTGAIFLQYVRQYLCPTLRPGDIVIADNLSSHKVAGVQQAIETCGASLCFLPPYSPDLNPIEMLFAKLKALLRKASKRTLRALWKHLGQLVDVFSPEECSHYFAAAGYVNF